MTGRIYALMLVGNQLQTNWSLQNLVVLYRNIWWHIFQRIWDQSKGGIDVAYLIRMKEAILAVF